MSCVFIVNFIGTAKPTDIHKLAAITNENGGRWLISKINFIDDRVAAVIKIEAPKGNRDYIKQAFLSYPMLTTEIKDSDSNQINKQQFIALRLDANDRHGIVNDITHLLDSQRIRVLDMNCQRIFISDRQGVNSTLFTANLSLKVPETINIKDVIHELESLSEDTKVILET